MIGLKELRVGNSIQDKHGNIESVNSILNDDVFERINDIDVDYYNPIPVTKDILVKAGFDHEDLLYNFGQLSIKPYYGTFDWVIFWKGHAILYVKDLYFHRLQNLIYDLSGNELIL